ncbi:1,4-dihydroxy-2-naphthoyl-CoA thioesterase 1-like isoform X1 [Canna indica]|uniref:1,4-dihydroxy-2-naphthoyl-CoA thioesterase 1-like isoform X1 n=1 Tax=Canna indica TaxID=4628 RepID=A0AAQ3PZ56_9LILI|nr:1,4-dihydroxy-2-naphthoyl-CoA thioesterase 1-like isoform X1 [Canna indica]
MPFLSRSRLSLYRGRISHLLLVMPPLSLASTNRASPLDQQAPRHLHQLSSSIPFNVLNGGVSALMAETLASLGAYVASHFRRMADIQLCTNHIRAALPQGGSRGRSKAHSSGQNYTTTDLGKVWEVQTRKIHPSTSGSNVLLSTSKVTLLCYQNPLCLQL